MNRELRIDALSDCLSEEEKILIVNALNWWVLVKGMSRRSQNRVEALVARFEESI